MRTTTKTATPMAPIDVRGRDKPVVEVTREQDDLLVRVDFAARPDAWAEVRLPGAAGWLSLLGTRLLNWRPESNYQEAQLGTPEDGVLFTLIRRPTCYRRGPYCLRMEVCGGANHFKWGFLDEHFKWGCLDEANQPTRYYHSEDNAKDEAERMARVLTLDRQRERD